MNGRSILRQLGLSGYRLMVASRHQNRILLRSSEVLLTAVYLLYRYIIRASVTGSLWTLDLDIFISLNTDTSAGE